MMPFLIFMGTTALIIVVFALSQAYHAWVYRQESDQQQGGKWCNDCGCFHKEDDEDPIILEILNRVFNTGKIVVGRALPDGTYEITEYSIEENSEKIEESQLTKDKSSDIIE